MSGLITRLSLSIAAAMIAALVALAGIGFLAFALYQALLERVSPAMAALVTGLAAFFFAALIILAGNALAAAAKRRRRREADQLAAELGDLLSDEFRTLAATHPQATALAALLAGFAVGAVPELRHVLRELLRKP